MSSAVSTFRTGWQFTRGLTYDFIGAVPDDRWEFKPHERFAAFHKQVRHLVCVQGVYIDAIRNRVTDFGQKHSHYAGPLDRESLVAALHDKDALLDRVLDATPDEESYTIEFYGTRTFASFLSVIPQHEAIHHGQWSFYASLAGFETPECWKLNWGL